MEKDELKNLLQSILFAADHSVSLTKLEGILEGIERADIKSALDEMMEETSGKGVMVVNVANGYMMRTNPDHAPWLRRLFKIAVKRLSKSAMEALAITAYKQPMTRSELDDIRGVDSGGVLRTLMDKRLIKIVGRKDAPGKPVVYGTTKEFLESFDLKDLSSLPSLKDLEEITEVLLGEDIDDELRMSLEERRAEHLIAHNISEADQMTHLEGSLNPVAVSNPEDDERLQKDLESLERAMDNATATVEKYKETPEEEDGEDSDLDVGMVKDDSDSDEDEAESPNDEDEAEASDDDIDFSATKDDDDDIEEEEEQDEDEQEAYDEDEVEEE